MNPNYIPSDSSQSSNSNKRLPNTFSNNLPVYQPKKKKEMLIQNQILKILKIITMQFVQWFLLKILMGLKIKIK